MSQGELYNRMVNQTTTSFYAYYYSWVNFNVIIAYTPSSAPSSTSVTKLQRYTTLITHFTGPISKPFFETSKNIFMF